MTETAYNAMRAYIAVAVELEVKKALGEMQLAEAAAPVVEVKEGPPGKDAVVDVAAIVKEVVTQIPAPKDGKDGKDAEPVDTVELAKTVLALVPVPRDGRDGVASVDEIKSIAASAVDERLTSEVQKAIEAKFAELPVIKYRGVYREGDEYREGNFATFGGSVWHANEDTTEKPGAGSKAWTLAVKQGRDAR